MPREVLDPAPPQPGAAPRGDGERLLQVHRVRPDREDRRQGSYQQPCHRIFGHDADLPVTDWVSENHWWRADPLPAAPGIGAAGHIFRANSKGSLIFRTILDLYWTALDSNGTIRSRRSPGDAPHLPQTEDGGRRRRDTGRRVPGRRQANRTDGWDGRPRADQRGMAYDRPRHRGPRLRRRTSGIRSGCGWTRRPAATLPAGSATPRKATACRTCGREDLHRALTTIAESPAMAVHGIHLNWRGEPLMNPRFHELLAVCAEVMPTVRLQWHTNGTMLTARRAREILVWCRSRTRSSSRSTAATR